MRTALILTVLAVALNVSAAPLTQGTKEFAVEGSYDPTTANGKSVTANASFGYFTVDNFEVGVSSGYSENDLIEGWNAGVFAEYHIANKTIFTPFLGASAKYYNTEVTEIVTVEVEDTSDTTEDTDSTDTTDDSSTDADTTSDDSTSDADTTSETTETVETQVKTETDAIVFEAKAGVKCFIARNISLSAAYVWAWANEDIYYDGANVESSDQRIEVGMRFYF